MTGSSGLTDTQKNKLSELSLKESDGKITEKQREELSLLIFKRDNPELSEGAKTYCQTWLKEQIYGRINEFSSKYTEKGNSVESEAIEFVSEQLKWGLVFKNEEHFEDEHLTGTPDIILDDSVHDIKNSWSCFTFPLFNQDVPDKDYGWQLQGYMALTGKEKAGLHYCLMDAPLMLVESEARKIAYKNGESEVSAELYDEVCRDMSYSDVDAKYRRNSFEISRDDSAIQSIRERVELCRQYIESVLKELL